MLCLRAASLQGTSSRSSAFHPPAPTEANMRWSCSAPLRTPTTLSTPTWRMSFHDDSGRGGRNSLSWIMSVVLGVSVFGGERGGDAGEQAAVDAQFGAGHEAR